MEILGEDSNYFKIMTAPENTAALGIPVKVENIEKELRQLWEADEARTNASLMNFAVYSEKEGSLEKNSDIVRDITREHACRAILIGLDKQVSERTIRAWITAHCHLAHGQKSVCCEQIAFHLTGHSRGRFRNTIFANLQSDLPLIFWWQGDLSDMFSEGLYRRINRLVIDSSEWQHPEESFKRMSEAWGDASNLVIQDLSWTRTYHYRLAVAALYDDPMAMESLPATQKIKLKAHPDHRFSALLMVAWYCDLAGWKRSQDLVDDGETSGSFRFEKKNGELVDVEIEYDTQSMPISKFEVISDSVRICISRNPGDAHLHHLVECNKHTLDTHGQADSIDSSELVADQLSRGGKNSLYKRIFPKFLELM